MELLVSVITGLVIIAAYFWFKNRQEHNATQKIIDERLSQIKNM